MNDRAMIAAQMMAAARVQSVQWAQADRDMLARHVVKDADALLKALAESEAEAMEWNASDQTVVYGLRYNNELYNAYQPEGSNAVPGDANDD